MRPLQEKEEGYIESLQERGKKSRAYRDYQMTGLDIANILHDLKHKALYIKLAKIHDKTKLLGMAKSVAENPNIKNHGAYFMRVLHSKNEPR